jgi:hypothetical protein
MIAAAGAAVALGCATPQIETQPWDVPARTRQVLVFLSPFEG